MNYIKQVYFKNKKIFLFSLIIFLIIIGLIFYFNYNKKPVLEEKKEYNLSLYGEEIITIYKGEEYIEPGYIANIDNQVVSDLVKVIGEVNINEIGTYIITYTIDDITRIRTINVIENPNALTLELVGEEKITIKEGEEYKELGCLAYFYEDDVSNQINITGEVDTNTPGIYYINYEITIKDQTRTLQRTVEVLEKLRINLSYNKDYTNKDIIVDIKVTGSNFSHLLLPNDETCKEMKTTYTISKNGLYKFLVYHSDGTYIEKSINITNIDKTVPKATCTAKIYPNKTEISITATDNLGIDKYIYNKSHISKETVYTINSKLNTVSVSIYDLVGNMIDVDCSLSTVKGLWVAHMKNNKEAVEAAIEEGFFGIEVDVHQSGNTFKLYHDSSNDPYKGYNLDMFLDTCKEKGITAVLDLKSIDDYSKLISLVKSKNMENNTIYQTWTGRVKKIYNLDNNARIWILIGDSTKNISGTILKEIKEVKDYAEGVNMLASNVDKNDISTIHDLGLTVCSYSYGSKLYSNADAATLRNWGSDYIMANNIDEN